MEPLLRPAWLSPRVCALCHGTLKRTASTVVSRSAGLQNSNRTKRRFKGYIAPEGGQARPITGFYAG